MKYIVKVKPPHSYTAWRKKVKGTQDEHYKHGLRNPLKTELHDALLREQGYLCAYTMKRIYREDSHIEHIKPESICRADCVGSDLDYENLVACFPREGMPRRYRYGAQERDDWWENSGKDFISPLQKNCEIRFRFDSEGNILWVTNRVAAETTVKVLRLDHPSLSEDRGMVITEFLFGGDRSSPLSEAEAHRAIKAICAKDSHGRFYQFCVAIRDALLEYIQLLRKQTRRRKFACAKL
jgi:uncharacterized protein (TIGR02646 family)